MTAEQGNSRERLIAKIQKLMALSESPNQNEAELAAAKVQELLHAHNVAEWELSKATGQKTSRVVQIEITVADDDTFGRYLLNGIASGYSCECLRYAKSSRCVIVGYESDTAAVRTVFDRLMALAPSMRARAYKAYLATDAGAAEAKRYKNLPNVWRRSYLEGFASGVRRQLADRKQGLDRSSEASTALVVSRDADMLEFLSVHFPNVRPARATKGSSHRGAFSTGATEGSRVNTSAGAIGAGNKRIGG